MSVHLGGAEESQLKLIMAQKLQPVHETPGKNRTEHPSLGTTIDSNVNDILGKIEMKKF